MMLKSDHQIMNVYFQKIMNRKNILKYFILFGNFLSVIILMPYELISAIPQSAQDDPRFAMGYLVVTYYDGVNPDGTGDSGPGIQEAIYDAFDNDLVVFFPPGVYQVNDALKCYYWSFWDATRNKPRNPPGNKAYALVGSSSGISRPIIKLAPDAAGYDDPSNPRPVVVWRYFTATNSEGVNRVEPENPLSGVPDNFRDQPNVIFGWMFRNIDIDLSNNPGAIGGVFYSAQYCGVMDTRIDATNGYAGIYGVPGRNSFIGNVEVEGGKYGIVNDASAAGSVLVGARLYNQTEYAILNRDFCPYSVVGFDIKTSAPRAVVTDYDWNNTTATGTITMVDGKIEMTNGGVVFDNSIGKNIYLENVYVKTSGEVLKSSSQHPIAGTGSWQHILQYTFTDQTPAEGDNIFDSYSIINGNISQDPEPVKKIENSHPPGNLVSRHRWESIQVYEGENDGVSNVKASPFNAKGDGLTDDWEAIQTAIDFSPNGKVFLPKGDYAISKPLVLKSNTQLMGIGQNKSIIYSTDIWEGGPGNALVETVDDADATTFFGFIGFWDEASAQENTNGGFIHWKAGKNSMVLMTRHKKKWGSFYGKEPRYNYWYSDNAGGKHFICPHLEEAGSNIKNRHVLIEGTKEPLVFYGLNVESYKSRSAGDIEKIETNVEIKNSENIRIHNMKREGSSPTIIIRDSKNIGVYGMGRLNSSSNSAYGGYNQIYGESDNILFANILLDRQKSSKISPILEEDIDGHPYLKIDYPNCISIYKRGELKDLDSTIYTSNVSYKIDENISLVCYPNPASTELNIVVNAPVGSKIDIKIYNVISNVVFSHTAKLFSNEYRLKWPKDETLPSGSYFVKVRGEKFSKECKIIL